MAQNLLAFSEDFFMDIKSNGINFLSGGGEMGELMRSKDWRQSLVGDPVTWPQSLRTSISIMLNSRFPMFLFWGPDLVCFYNDAYRPSLGESGKHPQMLGERGEIYWVEIWHIIKPLIDQVLAGKGGTWSEDQLIPIYRNGTLEDVYWTFSYSAVNDESGSTSGVFVTCVETTGKVKNLQEIESKRNSFKNMVVQAPVGVVILKGPDLIVEIANETYLTIINKTEKEFVGLPLFTSLPEVKDAVKPITDEVLKTGIPYNGYEFEIPLHRFGKSELGYFNFVYQPMRETDGSISGIMVVVTEVTDMSLAHRKSIDTEEKLKIILGASELGTWEWILKTDTVLYSKRYLDIFGYDDDSIILQHEEILRHIHPADIAQRQESLREAFKTGNLSYTARIIWNDKTIHWIEVVGKMFYDETNKPVKMLGTIRDVTAQKTYNQRLEESELRFRTVADMAPVFIWMAGTDMLCNFFNKAWLHFRGRSIEAEYGNGWAEGVHADDLQRCMDIYISSFEKREAFYMEYRLQRHDGEFRWISDNGVPRFTKDGLFEGYIGACMDIHERIIFEQKLKDSESRLRIAAMSSELGTWEYDPATETMSWDSASKQLFGSAEDTAGSLELFWSKVHPEDRDAIMQKMLRALDPAIADNYDAEYRVQLNESGEQRWLHAKGKAFFDEKNNPYLFSGTVLDITEKRIALDELKANEERFRFLANAMPQFVWTGTADGNLNYFNAAVYSYSGLTPEQIAKDGWLQIVHPEDSGENIKQWMHSIQTGNPFLFEHRFKRHDGQYRWQLSRAVPQKDELGRIQMWVGTSTDIDEIKKHEEQKNDFIKMANHELKTPVTTIKGYVQLLLKTHGNKTDETLTNALATIDRQVKKLTSLVSDLLDITKIETGKLPLNTEVFSLNSLIGETIKDMQASTQSHKLEFKQLADAMVFADKDRISQVLLNLFTNAFKYSPKADRVVVEVNKEDDMIVVSVQDFGIGIAIEDQNMIFDRFYRVSGKDEKTYPGFGIGLFIVKEIILRHNGRLRVKSEKNKGATFYFSLPVHKYVLSLSND
ncbi:hypothetical protein BH11BAC4_BH11BAC4_19380 [soil metagenome]